MSSGLWTAGFLLLLSPALFLSSQLVAYGSSVTNEHDYIAGGRGVTVLSVCQLHCVVVCMNTAAVRRVVCSRQP